ncbi:MAG: nucleoside phosphorylase [Roseburia sp.]|nr:nucleoside phosphorylase [Roseburia sp.]
MIIENQYPVCEYDTNREPIIKPIDFLKKCLPEKCVITFFRKELNEFVEENNLTAIAYLHSEVLDIPIYEYTYGTEKLCITMPFSTAPGAAVTIEELYAMGCEKFIICGGAGALTEGSKVGEIIVPVSAVRDEGTSYHYLEPSREVEGHKDALECIMSGLKEMGIPFVTGKTWTTDAMYRETPDMIERRRNEGCITVEMETAAFFAVSKYYDIPLAQLLYAGDDVSGETWDSRNWNTQKNVRANMIACAVELVKNM